MSLTQRSLYRRENEREEGRGEEEVVVEESVRVKK